MQLQLLSDVSIRILISRIYDELKARYFYEAVSNWGRQQGYPGVERYFAAEAKHENEHYEKLLQFCADWNVTVVLPAIDKLPVSFLNIPDIIDQAYSLEYNLLQSYNEDSRNVLPVDTHVFDFLGEFRKIQNDSVIEYATLKNKLALIDVNNGLDLVIFDKEVLYEAA